MNEIDEDLAVDERIEFFDGTDHHPDTIGWYINYYDEDGTTWDNIGPFSTREDAEAAQRMTELPA